MAKHARPSADLQVVESPKTVAVQISLPVLGALVDAKSALFDLCVRVGQQVLGVLLSRRTGRRASPRYLGRPRSSRPDNGRDRCKGRSSYRRLGRARRWRRGASQTSDRSWSGSSRSWLAPGGRRVPACAPSRSGPLRKGARSALAPPSSGRTARRRARACRRARGDRTRR